ncbi:Lrp/AsnC family transcriptional regulator [Pseudaestuariivita sp.]|uniref:Lrp/AsnC family transcriptional regulator n=1 Tax=Pseudaestuariivita sp. TaxID=2211669 RepID=UPI00405890CA
MIDETDRKLLALLQRDATLTAQQIGEVLNLSASQIGRRRTRLEEAGVIAGYRARLEPQALDLNVQAFVQVILTSHRPEVAKDFTRLVTLQPSILSVWTLTGEADYLLRVICADLAALNGLIHEILLPHAAVARVHSQIVMNQLKADAPLPI